MPFRNVQDIPEWREYHFVKQGVTIKGLIKNNRQTLLTNLKPSGSYYLWCGIHPRYVK